MQYLAKRNHLYSILVLTILVGLFFVFPSFVLADSEENVVEVVDTVEVVEIDIVETPQEETSVEEGEAQMEEVLEVVEDDLNYTDEDLSVEVSLSESDDAQEEEVDDQKETEIVVEDEPLSSEEEEDITNISSVNSEEVLGEFAISAEFGDSSEDVQGEITPNDESYTGLEDSFTTLSSDNPNPINNDEVSISDEISFSSSGVDPSPVSETVISDELSLVTLPIDTIPQVEQAISDELSFTTSSEVTPPQSEIAISGELSFTTKGQITPPPTQPEIAISGELSFTTQSTPTPPVQPEIAISEELSFQTPSGPTPPPTQPEIAISGELSFTTNRAPSGGGGGGGFRPSVPDPDPVVCKPYLLEFIRFGRQNNPFEVLKLKIFLNSFEGFNLPLTPIYDLETFRAVEIFQQRYSSDILTPWGITAPTGYVYITTTLKINYIVCGITDPITIDLTRDDIVRFVPAAEAVLPPVDTATTTPFEDLLIPGFDGEVGVTDRGFFAFLQGLGGNLVGALAFLPWLFLDNLCLWCWIIVIILLLIILYLLYRNRQLRKELGEKNRTMSGGVGFVPLVGKEEKENPDSYDDLNLPGVAAMDTEDDIDPEVENEYFNSEDGEDLTVVENIDEEKK